VETEINTFLPYPSFSESARVLDDKRLGKQRLEVVQILLVLAGRRKGWRGHPAVLMWRGYETSLAEYGIEICREWVRRGFRDNMGQKIREISSLSDSISISENPPWLGNSEFHRSHQSNLLRKNPTHYGKYFPGVPDDLPYLWPSEAKYAETEN